MPVLVVAGSSIYRTAILLVGVFLMSRRYKLICAAVAIAICPGSIPIALGYGAVAGYRYLRRRLGKRRTVRIVAAYHGRPWTDTDVQA